MSESKSQTWKIQAEKLLQSLRDVAAVSIILDTEGDVTEIEVLAEGQRPSKQMVRDIRSALRAEYQLEVDPSRIAVTQKPTMGAAAMDSPSVLSLPGASVVEEPAAVRIRFQGVTTAIDQNRCQVRVELALGDREAMGETAGTNSRSHIPRLVAEATLDAVSKFLDDSHELSLADINVAPFSGEEVVLVGVKFFKERGEKTLTGSCVVSHDLQQSIVYATLDALNRILGRLPYKEPIEFELRPTLV
jgi:hypothetical protein